MKKLKLDLNDLKVESFETTHSILSHKGTIKGAAMLIDSFAAYEGDCGGGGGGGTDWSNCACLSVTCPPTLACYTNEILCGESVGCVSDDCTQPPFCPNPETFSCQIFIC